MSIGHRLDEDELSDTSLYELYSQLGERDTPRLLEQPYRLDTEHDCPTGGGNSIDRKTKYIDRLLYQEVMDGEFKATGLAPEQIIGRWLDHEHIEKCIADGDNACDTYTPCHNRALRKEHEGVLIIHCPKSAKQAAEILRTYEATIWPGLVRCYHRPITRPAKDYWCGPLLDQPTERDDEILEILRRLGVADAAKRSKYDVRYGFGEKVCRDCRHWHPERLSQERKELAACRITAGLVRADRHCDLWMKSGTG
jgi:hypothetical protein